MKSCEKYENGEICNEPGIVEGCCYDHAKVCWCGEPMHFNAILCNVCINEYKKLTQPFNANH